ncbi:MAG: alanine racemase [Desulfobacteraceae bacterium]|nr:alanine racemase [Desulfobacteraceae bacterium]
MEYPLVKAKISLNAIQKNIQNLKQMTNSQSRFMAVVKAEAYGHGAVRVARTALKSGADWLGVARLHEAVELRNNGIDSPVLVFGYVHPSQVDVINDHDLVVTVYDLDMAEQLSWQAKNLRKPIKTHLKVDTGMGRVGMVINKDFSDTLARKQVLKDIEKMIKLPGIDLCGIYTHFASADSKDRTYTDLQINLFDSLLEDLKKNSIEFEMVHAANSAGIIEFPQSHYDMVRAGISIYGLYPSLEMDPSKIKLIPAMTLASIVTSVKKVSKGFYVSYGMTHETKEETTLASVPIGYADGFSRRFSSNGYMLVKGYKAPIVGRVCMDQTMIDVGGIPDINSGNEVVLIGSQGDVTIGADELANKINTINYEITSALTSRVKRVYSDSGSSSKSG